MKRKELITSNEYWETLIELKAYKNKKDFAKQIVSAMHELEQIVVNDCVIPDVSNWVAIKDQLPPDVTEKYMVLRNGEIEFDKWIFDGNKGYWWNYMGITHWMQIPEPPCC